MVNTEDSDPELPPDWWRPSSNLGFPQAIELTASIAAPLLAGFSITLLGVVAQASDRFLLPGPSLLLLAAAAVMFAICVQCGFWARQYLATPSETKDWYDEETLNFQLESIKARQRKSAPVYLAWVNRTQRTYQVGLLCLLAGIATVLPPQLEGDGSEHAPWRWIAAALVVCAFLFELFWIFGLSVGRVGWLRRRLVKLAVLWWFYPNAA
jgi:hypothetical protein